MHWNINEYIHGNYGEIKYNSKCAVYDLDWTLIKTKSGKQFAKDENDWEFWSNNVKEKLNELISKDYSMIIITNQKTLGDKIKLKSWQNKIDAIAQQLNIPFEIYASFENDKYRKPISTLWTILDNKYKIDKSISFYCGDAAGRKNDFSDTDVKFAVNYRIKFLTPETHFYNEKNEYHIDYPIDFESLFSKKQDYVFKSSNKELIIMVGYPASGKSSFVKNLEKLNYVRVNQDTLKTAKKCLTECEKNMNHKKNVVIDNTNPTKEKRANYITLAKKYNYQCRCIIIMTNYDLSYHNMYYRHLTENIGTIPTLVYNCYRKNYEEPTKEEGFYSIEKIDFVPDINKLNLDVYKQYYY